MKTLTCLAVAVSLATTALSQSLSMATLPEPAQKAIQAEAAGRTIANIEMSDEDGETLYSATISKSGEDRDITVAGDGEVRSLEISLEQAPLEVRQSINKTVGIATLDDIEESSDDGKVSYDVDMTLPGGATRNFTVEADGRVSSLQVTLQDTPAATRDTIQTEAANSVAKVGDIYRISDEDGISYDVEIKRNGKNAEFTVGQEGKLQSVQVFPEELPAAGQRTLRQRIAGGKLSRIDKEFEDDGKFMFHVEARKNGKPFDFMIGSGGRFRGME